MSFIVNTIRKVKRKINKYYLINRSQWFINDYNAFINQVDKNYDFELNNNFPCLNERFEESGVINGVYFFQDFFVAKDIYKRNPQKHVDIGSRIDGFVAHVACFREIEIFDIRNLNSTIDNIKYRQLDIMTNHGEYTNFCDSISCLHALEHFGLGRYGDKIDPDGHLKGFQHITKILKKGGIFYFSTPLGKQRVDFNAHRVFNMEYLLKWVKNDFEIVSFSYINDNGDIHENVMITNENLKNSFGCYYGCAIFILKKK